jgi:hypothetical protein
MNEVAEEQTFPGNPRISWSRELKLVMRLWPSSNMKPCSMLLKAASISGQADTADFSVGDRTPNLVDG